MNQHELIAAMKALGKDELNPPVEIGGDEVLFVDWDAENNIIILDTVLPKPPPEPTPVVEKEEPKKLEATAKK